MKKVMFVDLDGTLLTDCFTITTINKNAIKTAIAAGWDVILSTGNSYENSIKYYNELKLNTWLVTSQGQVISKPNLNIHNKEFINTKDVYCILEDYKNEIVNTVIETANGVYAANPNDAIVVKLIKNKLKKMPDYKLTKIIGLYIEFALTIKFTSKTLDCWEWDIGEKNKIVSFRPKNINKFSAMKSIIELEKYDVVAAFGNGRNDLQSLLNADYGIAMINSHPKVLKSSKLISEKDNNNSGVGVEIFKLLNNEFLR